MKNGCLFTTFLFFFGGLFSQTFTSVPGVIIPDPGIVTEEVIVSGIGEIDCDFGLSEVCIDISHNRDSDLDIYLFDPDGVFYELTTDNGGDGNNYIVTCFDMTAATSVVFGTAPFDGSYIPEGDLEQVNNGQNADGTWILWLRDDQSGTVGVLNEFSLTFSASVPCPGVPLEADCGGGTQVCSSSTFTGNSDGDGNFVDLNGSNDGCLNGEHESSWYYFQAASDGVFAFTIETAVDYDFAVWGPMAMITCPIDESPLRCSYAGTTGDTGLQVGAGDNSENDFGDGFVNAITALEGEVFILVIDNFTSDGSSFDLNWSLTDGASLDCTPLPVELTDVLLFNDQGVNLFNWVTASELNSDYFLIERSIDFIEWETVARVKGAGNTSKMTHYSISDVDYNKSINYYRLTQVDIDGESKIIGMESIDNRIDQSNVFMIVNLFGQQVTESYIGAKVYIYEDGSVRKVNR